MEYVNSRIELPEGLGLFENRVPQNPVVNHLISLFPLKFATWEYAKFSDRPKHHFIMLVTYPTKSY